MTAILPSISLDSIEDQEELYKALEALRDSLELKMQALSDIPDIENTAATVSAGYVQAEVQQIANDVQVVSDKLDLILGAIKLV